MTRISKGVNDGYVGAIFDDLLDEAGLNTARISMFGVDRVSDTLFLYHGPSRY